MYSVSKKSHPKKSISKLQHEVEDEPTTTLFGRFKAESNSPLL